MLKELVEKRTLEEWVSDQTAPFGIDRFVMLGLSTGYFPKDVGVLGVKQGEDKDRGLLVRESYFTLPSTSTLPSGVTLRLGLMWTVRGALSLVVAEYSLDDKVLSRVTYNPHAYAEREADLLHAVMGGKLIGALNTVGYLANPSEMTGRKSYVTSSLPKEPAQIWIEEVRQTDLFGSDAPLNRAKSRHEPHELLTGEQFYRFFFLSNNDRVSNSSLFDRSYRLDVSGDGHVLNAWVGGKGYLVQFPLNAYGEEISSIERVLRTLVVCDDVVHVKF